MGFCDTLVKLFIISAVVTSITTGINLPSLIGSGDVGDVISPHSSRHCDGDWIENYGWCYLVLEHHYPYQEECILDCQRNGGEIASIHSDAENSFILSLLGKQAWLGAARDRDAGHTVYRWIDGSTWEYDHWRRGHPNRGGNCAYIDDTNEFWYDIDCEYTGGSGFDCVCKK